ncbi:Methylmuconolactone methyl-isomerase [compost metagenome]
MLKRMSIITRLPSVSEEDFRREWTIHGELVRGMAGVSAYRQNVIVGRERVKGQPCSYDELPMDGIVELWFKDATTLEAAFNSEVGRKTMAHAKTFLSHITAFVVGERKIL